MSRPPSSARGPTSASVPASQNTAPVIKFRCLFTHDIRRKAKRWQDGYLRFHTFNKRAMVYDDAGNFIGDHHWRDSSVIQDGDELELDKGVLIQVSECMETTQADLSALFEKRKASQESPQQERSSSALPSSRTPLAPRTAPPKSLNDLLGIKRPSVGRTILPQSPYDQRHSSPAGPQIHQQDEPPAKRQKQQPSRPLSRPVIAQKEARNNPEVIEIGESDSQRQWEKRVPTKPLVPCRSNDLNSLQQLSDDAPEPALNSSIMAQREKSLTPRGVASARDNRRLERVNPASRISVPATTIQVPSGKMQPEEPKPDPRGANVPLNPLRMSMEKPRPKLMYKAHTLKTSSSSTTATAQASSNQPLDGSLFTQSNSDFAVSASTLAILESIDDDGSLLSRGGTRNADNAAQENIISKQPTSQSLRTTALYKIPPHSAIYGSAASPAGLEISEDDFLSPPPVNIEHNNGTALTEAHTPVRSHSDLSSMLPGIQSMVLAANPQASECKGTEDPEPAVRRSDAKPLRKSYSDTSALRNAEQHRHGPSLPVATGRPVRMDPIFEKDKGPWTAEASDLFDWWPPGRLKP